MRSRRLATARCALLPGPVSPAAAQRQVGRHARQEPGDRPWRLASGAAVPDDSEAKAGIGLLRGGAKGRRLLRPRHAVVVPGAGAEPGERDRVALAGPPVPTLVLELGGLAVPDEACPRLLAHPGDHRRTGRDVLHVLVPRRRLGPAEYQGAREDRGCLHRRVRPPPRDTKYPPAPSEQANLLRQPSPASISVDTGRSHAYSSPPSSVEFLRRPRRRGSLTLRRLR